MKIPPYWTAHVKQGIRAWGWSMESMVAAERDAEARADRILARLAENSQKQRDYDYLDRPMREEILGRITHDGGEIAILTRNKYGAVVLNSASVCFVDIDFVYPRSKLGFAQWLGLLFSPARRRELAKQEQEVAEGEAMLRIKAWSRQNSGRSYRLYRTFAGFRMMLTDRLYDPAAPETDQILHALGSDPFYRHLTKKQECFRARLTPKPWRCGCRRPPSGGYPWSDSKMEMNFRRWLSDYETRGAGFAACRLIEVIGDTPADGHIDRIIEAHDRHACNSARALA
ncbi:hypothetical protein LLG95_17850 [bacterium]|nr:hypothetical protein [bacterium]